ncbi:F-box only protein 2-like [Aphis craccivora]|uniref:F-box only protein 2-like n=1 Tax=Aphis craccivora TaxID=307492 RepID=A0A6G0ZBA1_APHCR|nr:F-box only protein 2-like [Aphis craccivora]
MLLKVLKNNQLFDILPGAMAMKHIHLDQCKRFFRLLACEMKRLQERFDAYVFHGKAAIENEKIELPWYLFNGISKYKPFDRNLIKNHCRQGMYYDSLNIFQTSHGEHILLSADSDFDGHTNCFGVDF